jgi:hypothetical protein
MNLVSWFYFKLIQRKTQLMSKVEDFLTKEEEQAIVEAIRIAEKTPQRNKSSP